MTSQVAVLKDDGLLAFSKEHGLPCVDLGRYEPDLSLLSIVPEEAVRRLLVLPLFEAEHRLYLAVTEPDNFAVQDYVRRLTGLPIEPVLAQRQALEAAIDRYFKHEHHSWEEAVTEFLGVEEGIGQSIHIEDEDAPIIKIVNQIFSKAIRLNASDIHLEPFGDRALLRFRVDGVLHEFHAPPLQAVRAIVSRIKILARLDIAERRLPQDGRARLVVEGRECDFRISIMPNLHGEGVVIRILDSSAASRDLDDSGLASGLLSRYRRLIRKPYGMILVTGPTGSGKSTTLYASLRDIFTLKKKIITLEDPVEYETFGVTQIQVQPDIGYDFAKGLRSTLRHDPDIILVGEIRDLETAEIAFRSSLTGHLVFSTLHTNDSISAVTRLLDMGVEPFMLFSSLICVLAQRLLRRLCPECKVEADLGEAELSILGVSSLPRSAKLYRPRGCGACNNLGYRGRIAIGELFEVTSEMRRFSPEKLVPGLLKKLAAEKGFLTLRQSALEAVYAGITSVEEVVSLTDTEE